MIKELTIIEDQPDLAQYYRELLNLNKEIRVNTIIVNTGIASLKLNLKKDKKQAFLVDINLNELRKEDEEGLNHIKNIKENLPETLVIAYSARSLKRKALEVGANYFFLKEPDYIERDFTIINKILLEYFEEVEEIIKEPSRKMGAMDKKLSEIALFQNKFIKKNTQNQIDKLKIDYDTLIDVRKIKQEKLGVLMKANAKAIKENVQTNFSNEKAEAELKSEIEELNQQVEAIYQEILKLNQSLENLL